MGVNKLNWIDCIDQLATFVSHQKEAVGMNELIDIQEKRGENKYKQETDTEQTQKGHPINPSIRPSNVCEEGKVEYLPPKRMSNP